MAGLFILFTNIYFKAKDFGFDEVHLYQIFFFMDGALVPH